MKEKKRKKTAKKNGRIIPVLLTFLSSFTMIYLAWAGYNLLTESQGDIMGVQEPISETTPLNKNKNTSLPIAETSGEDSETSEAQSNLNKKSVSSSGSGGTPIHVENKNSTHSNSNNNTHTNTNTNQNNTNTNTGDDDDSENTEEENNQDDDEDPDDTNDPDDEDDPEDPGDPENPDDPDDDPSDPDDPEEPEDPDPDNPDDPDDDPDEPDETQVITTLRIVTASDNAGNEVSDPIFTAGENTIYYAAAYDQNNTYMEDVTATWEATGVLDGMIVGNDESVTLSPTLAGSDGTLSASYESDNPDPIEDTIGTATVEPGALAAIKIRSESNNAGIEVNNPSFTAGDDVTYYAAGYDAYNNYRNDVAVTWIAGGVLSDMIIGSDESVILSPTLAGSDGTLSATYISTPDVHLKIKMCSKIKNFSLSEKIKNNFSQATLFPLNQTTKKENIDPDPIEDTVGTATVEPGTLAAIKIRSESNNAGTEVNNPSFTAGDDVTYYAAGYDAYNNYRNDVAVTWTAGGVLNGTLGTNGEYVISFEPQTAGSNGTLTATHALSYTDTIGTAVTTAGALAVIKIRTASDGSGDVVLNPSITTLSETTYYAAGYDAYDNYVSEEDSVNWSPGGVLTGMVTDNEDGSATINATQGGVGATLTATTGAINDSIGSATVTLNTPDFPTLSDSLEDFAEDERVAITTYNLDENQNNYIEPTEQQLMKFYEVVDTLRQYVQDQKAITWETELKNTISALNYEVYNFTDTVSSNNFFLLREKTMTRNGWGWLVINKDPSNNILIATPHPIHDFKTSIVGAKATSMMDNIGMIASGAHRNCSTTLGNERILNNYTSSAAFKLSDPSHYAKTIFNYTHLALLKDADVAIQPHGYTLAGEKETCMGAGYQAVISSGSYDSNAYHTALDTAVDGAGYNGVIFAPVASRADDDGVNIALSCFVTGTMTLQGYDAKALGKTFIQYEADINLRNTDEARTVNATIIHNALTP